MSNFERRGVCCAHTSNTSEAIRGINWSADVTWNGGWFEGSGTIIRVTSRTGNVALAVTANLA